LKVKERIKYYLEKDYFKVGAAGINKVKKTNKFFFIGAGTVIAIVLFYLILNITTNYHKLDNFEDYIEEFNKGQYPTKFKKINLGIKIMPSYNLEKNILFMRQSTDPLKSIIYGSSSLANSYGINPTYFRTNQTRKVFPKFSFTKENIPLGNSISLCMAANWGEIERGKHYEIMKPVKGLPQCSSVNEKFIWNEDDPIYGIDIPAWKQFMYEVDCNYEDCEEYCKDKYGGAFVKGINKNVCYSYEILQGICMVIKYDPLRDDYTFHGGCYPGNNTYRMVPGILGEEVNFNNVKIEIRELNDPIVQAGEWTDYGYNLGHYWRYISFVLKFVLLAALGLLGYVLYDIYKTREKYKGAPNLIGDEENKGMPGGLRM